jgi:hypothetical protein
MTQDATQPIFAPQDMQKGGMFGSTPSDAKKPDAPAEQDWPSADSIERRRRLAEAMMGRQMEVNHPMQAVANAVNQIAGAYVQNKAEKDEAELQRRRRDFFLGSLKDGGTFEGMMTKAMTSPDPALQDMAVKYQLSALEARGKRKGQAPDDVELKYSDGTAQRAYWDDEGGDWVTYGDRYPRWQSSGGGGGGGGSGGGGGGGGSGGGIQPTSQGSTFALPSGRIVVAPFVKGRGFVYRDESGQYKDVPYDARPVTASGASPMVSKKEFYRIDGELRTEEQGLKKLEEYYDAVGNLKPGAERLANRLAANVKTFFNSGEITDEQFKLLTGQAKYNAIRGALRIDIVGPGVASNFDMMVIEEALGGQPLSALQNPEVVKEILRKLYAEKMRRVEGLKIQFNEQAPYHEREPWSSDLPSTLNETAPASPGQGGGGQYKPVPRDQLRDGQVYTMKDGRPARWDASKQKFFPVR